MAFLGKEGLSSFMQSRTGQYLAIGVAAALLVLSLWLPPASIGNRLFRWDVPLIRADEGGSVIHPIGALVTFAPEAMDGNARVQLGALNAAGAPGVLASDSLAALAPEGALDSIQPESGEAAALAALPAEIAAYSPFYQITTYGNAPGAAQVSVPVPYELTDLGRADLYVWDGAAWRWTPSQPTADGLALVSEVEPLPQIVAVAAANDGNPVAAMVVDAEQAKERAPENAAPMISVAALSLADGGGLAGQAPRRADLALPAATQALLAVSNVQDGIVRSDLVDNLLIDATARAQHVEQLMAQVEGGDYAGVELAYEGVDPALHDDLTALVTEMAAALHETGRILAVRVETPQVAGSGWNTGAYDWRALGAVADLVRIPALVDPAAYAPGGEMDRLLAWATGEIQRSKVQLAFSTYGHDVAGDEIEPITYEKALMLLSQGISVETPATVIMPGETLRLRRTAESNPTLQIDADSRVSWFQYTDDEGQERTVWMETGRSAARKLQYVTQHALGGVSLEDALEPENDMAIASLVQTFQEELIPAEPVYAMLWRIQAEDGTVIRELVTSLEESDFAWTAPERPGQYAISAAISDDGGQTERGVVTEIEVVVPSPTPTNTPTPTPMATPTPEPTATPTPAPQEASVFMAQFVADVTVKDNTQFDKGATFTKTWRLRNSGAVAWPEDTLLVFQSGEQLSETKEVAVGAVAPGAEVDISVAMQAPNKDAVLQSRWALTSNSGTFRGGSVYVQIRSGETTTVAAPAAPAAPAPRTSTGFGYGIQAHIYGGDAQIYGLITGMGFNWVKQQVEWSRIETAKGQYNWGDIDRIVSGARAAGLNILLSVVKAPAWARPGGDFSVEGPPNNPQDFADFMGAMAARYKGRVQAYEVWNEQNLHYEWGNEPINAARYVDMLRRCYSAIKAADPGAIVVSGAPTPTGMNDGKIAIDDRLYLEQMYQAGLARYCDAVGVHPSGYNNPPDADWRTWSDPSAPSFKGHPSFFFRGTMEGYRNIMVKYGDGNKRLWPTEFGWSTFQSLGTSAPAGYEYANHNTEAEQAQFLVRSIEMMRSWGWVGPVFVWNLNFAPVAGPADEKAGFGIVRHDWSLRPAYHALRDMRK
jgi:hypothetical protein